MDSEIATQNMPLRDVAGEPPVCTAEMIKRILSTRHLLPGWVYATEVPTATGILFSAKYAPQHCLRRIDAFAISTWPSTQYRRIGYEIKVTRSDWLKELASPEKSMQARNLTNQFYFVLGPGVYQPTDLPRVPPECGVWAYSEDAGKLSIRYVRRAKRRDIEPMPIEFIVGLMRRVAQMGVPTSGAD